MTDLQLKYAAIHFCELIGKDPYEKHEVYNLDSENMPIKGSMEIQEEWQMQVHHLRRHNLLSRAVEYGRWRGDCQSQT